MVVPETDEWLSWRQRGLIREQLYSKFSFGEVYLRIYGQKFGIQLHASGTIKCDFRPYIQQYTSPNKTFENGYPFLKSRLKLECCKLYKVAHHPKKCDAINDINLFSTVYIQSDVGLQKQVI